MDRLEAIKLIHEKLDDKSLDYRGFFSDLLREKLGVQTLVDDYVDSVVKGVISIDGAVKEIKKYFNDSYFDEDEIDTGE